MMLRRRAFTMIDLIVVILIIAVLIALLMPAVMRARASAIRTQCANNLRQISVALHNYHALEMSFPPGIESDRPGQPYPFVSWLTLLLPHLEQDALSSQTDSAYKSDPWPFDNPPHIGMDTPIKVFACPADPRVLEAHDTHQGYRVASTSYVGVLGTAWNHPDGVLFQDSSVRVTDIIDGASNTLIVGERPPSPDYWYGWWYAGSGQSGTGSGDMLLGVTDRYLGGGYASDCPLVSYQFQEGQPGNECDVFHFWSLHPGGANFIFADGSVHFLSYRSAPLLPALATRAGGEVSLPPD